MYLQLVNGPGLTWHDFFRMDGGQSSWALNLIIFCRPQLPEVRQVVVFCDHRAMIQRKNRDGPMGHGKPSKIEKLWISWRYLWVFFMNDDFCVLKPANKIVKHRGKHW
jgi:hypothetical protein